MKRPNVERAVVARRRITEYLLSAEHPSGKSKASFFLDFGFTSSQWTVMAHALKLHALTNELVKVDDSPFGKRYVIERLLETPSGTSVNVRTAWFIETGEEIPHFVTAFPLQK
jgi:hypothetical protein